jgi:ABC-type polysaccharide/polyol phosphate export permease
MLIQVTLLLALVLAAGKGMNRYWLYLPLLWTCETMFICGLALISSSLNVYIRDMRYVVESSNTLLFWLVPIFYPFSIIPQIYREVYQFNPVAALVLACRNILLENSAPPASLVVKLAVSSTLMVALGLYVFRRLRSRFYDYL